MRPLTPTEYGRWLRQDGHTPWPTTKPRWRLNGIVFVAVLACSGLLSLGIVGGIGVLVFRIVRHFLGGG